jgi:hypothetical protein
MTEFKRALSQTVNLAEMIVTPAFKQGERIILRNEHMAVSALEEQFRPMAKARFRCSNRFSVCLATRFNGAKLSSAIQSVGEILLN